MEEREAIVPNKGNSNEYKRWCDAMILHPQLIPLHSLLMSDREPERDIQEEEGSGRQDKRRGRDLDIDAVPLTLISSVNSNSSFVACSTYTIC